MNTTRSILMAFTIVVSQQSTIAVNEFSPDLMLKPKVTQGFLLPANQEAGPAYEKIGDTSGLSVVFYRGFKSDTPAPLRIENATLVEALDQLRPAFPSAAPELFQAGTQRGAVVRIVHERHGLDDNGDERELRVPEQRLHEPCETELKSPRALIGHEKRDSQRYRRRLGAGDFGGLARYLHLEIRSLEIGDGQTVLVCGGHVEGACLSRFGLVARGRPGRTRHR